jgi:hypothetical protein
MSGNGRCPSVRPVRVLLVLLALAGCSTPAPQQQNIAPTATPAPVRYEGPPLPFEDEGACPFEGCTYRAWTTNTPVRVLTERRQDAPVAFELPKGARVTALTGVVVTVVPGIVELTDTVQLQTGQGVIPMREGQVFYLLTYQGEGFSKAWINGAIHTDVDVTKLKPKRNPTAIWWVQVRNARGQVGWTHHPEAFDGKDRLG